MQKLKATNEFKKVGLSGRNGHPFNAFFSPVGRYVLLDQHTLTKDMYLS